MSREPLFDALVLVVEDELIVAKDIEQTLGALGYRVAGAVDNGPDAVATAVETSPDVVLMDVRLRGEMDGVEAARQIRLRSGVPIVFLTAHADEGTLARAADTAPYGYVLKPFDDRELHVAIIMAVVKHRAFAELDTRVRERTNELVQSEARYRQMAALAELSVFAVRTRDTQAVLERAARVVAETLDAELTSVLELVPEGNALVVRAGAGIVESAFGSALVAGQSGSQAGYTLGVLAPVVAEDLREERRFYAHDLVERHGVTSGVSVVIHGVGHDGRPYGVLSAHTRARRTFSAYDVGFVQAAANTVANAVQRARTEEQLRQAERLADEERVRATQAQEALRIRDEFLSIASHELKTPLTVLQLQLQSLTERFASLDENVVTKVTRALRNTDRLAHLVESLLDVSRIATGRMQLSLERIALNDLVAHVADGVREQAATAGCDVRVELGEPAEGEWDRVRVEQAITNLLSNAFKYGRSQPVRLVTRRTADAAEIAVIDGGPGIAPESAARIFERFERAASVRHYGGLGLGLYVTREIVAAHHGSVALQSRPGAGAEFVIRLPLAPAEPRAIPSPARELN